MYKVPDFLVEYQQIIKKGPPKCCHTCDFYGREYMFCTKYDTNPPEDFASTQDACADYYEIIPF